MKNQDELTPEHEAQAQEAVEKYRAYMVEHAEPELIANGRLEAFMSCFNTGYRCALIDVELGYVRGKAI